ncbi:hypothetical protein [Micrococcus sp. 116]|nr:hypothetical protein [Micrococcus sp. 116]VWX50184.1 conserved hypothetical protein [Micrococcus sp. 116]
MSIAPITGQMIHAVATTEADDAAAKIRQGCPELAELLRQAWNSLDTKD